jgi:chromosome segregation ATPase
LLAEAKAIIQEVRSNADARVHRTIREADARIDHLKADAQDQIGRLQNELAQATCEINQINDEAATRIESVKKEANARVDAVEAEAKKRIDVIRRENEDKVLRLEADLTEAKDRADRAERCLMLIRREIEDHLTPATSASTGFRRLWLRVTSMAAFSCRVRADIEPASSLPGFSNGLRLEKTGNTAMANEPSAPSRSGENSAASNPVTAG